MAHHSPSTIYFSADTSTPSACDAPEPETMQTRLATHPLAAGLNQASEWTWSQTTLWSWVHPRPTWGEDLQ